MPAAARAMNSRGASAFGARRRASASREAASRSFPRAMDFAVAVETVPRIEQPRAAVERQIVLRAIAAAKRSGDIARAGGSKKTCAFGSVRWRPRNSPTSPRVQRIRASVRAACPTICGGILPGWRCSCEPRVRDTAPEAGAVREEVDEGEREFLVGAGAKADRPGEAFAFRDTVVRDSRRKIEHVAGLEHPFLLGPEVGKHLERKARDEIEVGLARNLPSAPPRSLQEEDVVGVHVRPDAAARHRIAHHDIVDAGMRDEGEPHRAAGRLRRELVGVLHQDGPVAFRQAGEFRGGERPAAQVPAAAALCDKPRLRIGIAGERQHLRGAKADRRSPGMHHEGAAAPSASAGA